jgi:hypothetical protein
MAGESRDSMEPRRCHIRLGLNYCQSTVCQAELRSLFNDWTEIHANQGFTWRPGSVSFGTFGTFGTFDTDTPEARVLVELRDRFIPRPLAVRIIKVPFEVGATGVELTTPVGESRILDISPGHYAVYFAIEPHPDDTQPDDAQGGGSGWRMSSTSVSTGYDADEHRASASDAVWRYHLTFVLSAEPVQAAIIRTDNQLSPPSPLLMEAEPA